MHFFVFSSIPTLNPKGRKAENRCKRTCGVNATPPILYTADVLPFFEQARQAAVTNGRGTAVVALGDALVLQNDLLHRLVVGRMEIRVTGGDTGHRDAPDAVSTKENSLPRYRVLHVNQHVGTLARIGQGFADSRVKTVLNAEGWDEDK